MARLTLDELQVRRWYYENHPAMLRFPPVSIRVLHNGQFIALGEG